MPSKTNRTIARKNTRAAEAKETAVKKVAAKKAVVKKAPARKAVVKKTTARKTAAKKAALTKKPTTTRIIAKFDAGFGNELHLRGSGSELNWETGTAMQNVEADEWIWSSDSVTGEVEFKVLMNDKVWSSGPNGVVFPGATVVFEPIF